MISKEQFLILNLAVAFYNGGTIWAHEVDIFRSWRLLDAGSFHAVQRAHWRRLPYWVFIPAGLAFAGAVGLFWYHPEGSPEWVIGTAFGLQLLSHLLTLLFWGSWQAALSRDILGAESIFLKKILATHWVRTFLFTAYALLLLLMAWKTL